MYVPYGLNFSWGKYILAFWMNTDKIFMIKLPATPSIYYMTLKFHGIKFLQSHSDLRKSTKIFILGYWYTVLFVQLHVV